MRKVNKGIKLWYFLQTEDLATGVYAALIRFISCFFLLLIMRKHCFSSFRESIEDSVGKLILKEISHIEHISVFCVTTLVKCICRIGTGMVKK